MPGFEFDVPTTATTLQTSSSNLHALLNKFEILRLAPFWAPALKSEFRLRES